MVTMLKIERKVLNMCLVAEVKIERQYGSRHFWMLGKCHCFPAFTNTLGMFLP